MKTNIDVSTHDIVPKHYIISEEERQKLIEKYRITKMNQFPVIKLNDPAVQAIQAKVGDIIKIIRKSNVSKETVYYRIVAE